MVDAQRRSGQPGRARTVTTELSKVFEFNTSGINWPRGVMFLDLALVPLILFWAIGHQEYLLSAVFGALFAGLADPGGPYTLRLARLVLFSLAGAALTALAFAIGGAGWGWLVLAGFGVTLLAGLAATQGAHAFAAAVLLNVWFIVALALGEAIHRDTRITSHTWAQVLAWVAGSALWIAATLVVWLINGRGERPRPVAELPGDTTRRRLTPPLAVFAAIRALALAASVAISFGLNLPHAGWLPIATIVALKPSLEQATLIAVQRIVGALIGAAAAILLLLIPANEHGPRLFVIDRGMEIVAIVVFMHAIAIRFWNYAIYSGAVAAAALILVDLARPADYSAEGDRVLSTIGGVGIGVLVMGLASLLAKHRPRTTG